MDQSTRNPLPHRGSRRVDLTSASCDPGPDRSRKEDIREAIKAAAIVGATLLGLRLYAALAPSSPW